MPTKTPIKKKVKYPEYSTSDITKTAINILTHEFNATVWRNNQIPVRGQTFKGKKGVADLIGYTNDRAITVMCEVKKIGDRLSEDQIKLLTDLHEKGGVALIATQVEIKVVVIPFIQYINKAA